MVRTLLTTKFYQPALPPRWVRRPRLAQRLDEGLRLRRQLTLVSAPAGFGKTTLLGAWVRGVEAPVAWLSLSPEDDEPVRFWTYVIAALQTVHPNLGDEVLEVLRSPQAAFPPAALAPLVNDIAALPEPLLLVLDDYHVIAHPAVHEGLGFLLAHQPRQLHLILATRADPPLPLARLRGRGQMTELRARDLRFTEEEAAAFLNDALALDLTPADVAALEGRTEGWIAGLQMAAIALQGMGMGSEGAGSSALRDRSAFIEAFAGDDRYVADYLVEEVLRREPPELQRFLLQTSILGRMNASLAAAVCDLDEAMSRAHLNALETANLFVVPLDSRREWYRYHHLFADLLRQRLGERHGESVPTLHQRAARWYESQGLLEDAVGHALKGEAYDLAADLIERAFEGVAGRGLMAASLRWMDALPEAQLAKRPSLCVYRAWAFTITNRLDRVPGGLQGAEEALESKDDLAPEVARDLRGQIAAIRSYGAWHARQLPRVIELLQEARAQVAEGNAMTRTAIYTNLGRAYVFSNRVAEAIPVLQEARALGWASNHLAGMAGTAMLGVVRMAQGRLAEVEELCREAIDEYEARHGRLSPALCHIFNLLGRVEYERDHLDEAAGYLLQSLEWGQRIGYGMLGNTVRISTAGLEWMRGLPLEEEGLNLPPAVVSFLDEVPAEAEIVDMWGWRVRSWLRDDPEAALRWADRYRAGEGPLEPWPIYGDLALARVLASQGRVVQALGLLDAVRREAEGFEGRGVVIETLVLEGVWREGLGEGERALGALARALELAQGAGYARVFLDEGAALLSQLRRALASGVASGYARGLLEALTAEVEALPGTGSPPPAAENALVEPLTDRELEVVRLLPTELSQAEIGEALFIARSTVRSHIKNIYGKLDVSSRTQAVIRAQELGLL
jgi:LuxR family maltose regulon positive regulatory protein